MEQSASIVHVICAEQMEEPSNMGGRLTQADVFIRLNKPTALGFKTVLVRR
jgi:hypothetical protein